MRPGRKSYGCKVGTYKTSKTKALQTLEISLTQTAQSKISLRASVAMKVSSYLVGAWATLAAAQTPAPYTDSKSGITFNTLQHSSGMFFGLALPENATGNTDFIATIGGKGTGYSGVSFGGGMLGKLLFIAWPNQQSVVSSFRKTAYVFARL